MNRIQVHVYVETCNTLETYLIETSPTEFDIHMAMLLFAGGEIVQGTVVERLDHFDNFRKIVSPLLTSEDHLKHMCRSAIRKHLLRVNSSINLFVRIPQLGFPSLLKNYLLYKKSLEIKRVPISTEGLPTLQHVI